MTINQKYYTISTEVIRAIGVEIGWKVSYDGVDTIWKVSYDGVDTTWSTNLYW
ncbi:hypothetical protein AGMMS49950_05610 [Endomicrobiia bacterium]|nr:hypothetical protein AGMMS49950_05610 [Endomicrobiia bacterium]